MVVLVKEERRNGYFLYTRQTCLEIAIPVFYNVVVIENDKISLGEWFLCQWANISLALPVR